MKSILPLLRLMFNDVRYRCICAFCFDNRTKDYYAGLWLKAFETFRQTEPTIWLKWSWRVKVLYCEAHAVAFVMKVVWAIQDWQAMKGQGF